MRYRELGSTGLKVSEIAMGCEGFMEDEYRMTGKLLDLAQQNGINYFDLYASDPQMRAAVGRALKGRRDSFIIQSHICSVWKNGQYLRTRELPEVKAGFEEMMSLLGTDHIEVGMIHYCDSLKDWQKIIDNGVLDYAGQLKKEGRILHIGLSSHNPEVALKAVESGAIEVLMFSVNPCYDLQPASENVEDLWADQAYEHQLTNMDPQRQRLYEVCQEKGIGITVMKPFGGGDLLDAALSPAGAAMTVNQCIHYCLTRPAVACVNCGAHSPQQLLECIAYEDASDSDRDYAQVLSSFNGIRWEGHCMYCNHCLPCVSHINIADVTRFLNLTKTGNGVPETVREHYRVLEQHASDCIQCGACETRCPFHVQIRQNMQEAVKVFGY